MAQNVMRYWYLVHSSRGPTTLQQWVFSFAVQPSRPVSNGLLPCRIQIIVCLYFDSTRQEHDVWNHFGTFWINKVKFTRAGFEPATSGLTCRCSTKKLCRGLVSNVSRIWNYFVCTYLYVHPLYLWLSVGTARPKMTRLRFFSSTIYRQIYIANLFVHLRMIALGLITSGM